MRTIPVPIPGAPYEVLVSPGLLDEVGSRLATLVQGRTAFVVTDKTVAALYLNRLTHSLENAGFRVCSHAVPPGEPSKSQAELFGLYERFLEAGVTRSDVVVALGGGVPGDLGGFAAATWMRGVPFVQVPTTLLAMVDSSVGGKTGIDLPGGKNLVGAFHQPLVVLTDPDTLKTLPDRVFADGMAEVVKHGAILDAELFGWCAAGGPAAGESTRDMEWAVARNVGIKAGVVVRDTRESGERMLLNFGHTVGHAVERVTGYLRYTHGEAVAIGMAVACRMGVRLGVTSGAVASLLPPLLAGLGLPFAAPELDANEVAAAVVSDKKNRSGKIHVILLQEIGRATIVPLDEAQAVHMVSEVWQDV
ncbi:MAG: 3-dehydroquinate synthase [Clostridiaceae bacterium]|nr:3-dehydroquinate synthase [Clostridiaceae bacterium]